jgi:hypothetical protein
MYPLTKTIAAAGMLVALTAATSPGHAEELLQNLGPVGPHEPILTDVGTKRVIAWFRPDGSGCAVTGVVWNRTDVEGTSTAGVRIRLDPGQVVHFDSSYNDKSLNLKCAEDAGTLSIVNDEELVAFDIERRPTMRASASDY